MTTIANLYCENLPEPLGISNSKPRLSWDWTSNSANSFQRSYHIQVSERNDFSSCVWDSGEVISDRQVAIAYAGEDLLIRTGYYWRVKISTSNDEFSGWSSPAYFETGFFSISDWDSCWFSYLGPRRDSSVNHLRKEFEIPDNKAITRARAYVGATCGMHYEDTFRMNLYTVRLNGLKISKDLYNPGQLSPAKQRALYRTYDITDMLQSGCNAIGVIYAAYRISMQVMIEFEDGTQMFVNTGEMGWKWQDRGPFVNLWYRNEKSYAYGGRGEIYDANMEFTGWDLPGYDDGAWTSYGEPLPEEEKKRHYQGPTCITAAPAILKAQMQSVEISEVLEAQTISTDINSKIVIDFGQVFNGHQRIVLRGKKGDRIVMRFGECLFEDGTVNFCTTWGSAKEDSTHEDIYVKKSDEPELYSPTFANHCFRYIEISGITYEFKQEDISAYVVHSTVINGSKFSCSNERVMKLHNMGLWSSRANLMSVPTDCAGRERQGWVSSGGLPAATECTNFDMRLLYEKWFDDICDSQYSDGLIPVMCPPALTVQRLGAELLQYSLLFLVPQEAYKAYGDKNLLIQIYPALRNVVNYINNFPLRDGLSRGHIIWNDWKSRQPIDRTFLENTCICCIYRSFMQIAVWLDKDEDVWDCRKHFEERKDAINRSFFAGGNRYGDLNLQSENLMALYSGIVAEEHISEVTKALVEDIEERGALSSGAFSLYYLLQVLASSGRNDLIWSLMQSSKCYTIGYWANPEHKLTALPESWSVFDKDGDHTNHHDFDSFGYWFYRELVGIKPLKPGYKEFKFEPYIPDNLDKAFARIETVYGVIYASWKKTAKGMKFELEVPANTKAYVKLPTSDKDSIIVGSGKHSYVT